MNDIYYIAYGSNLNIHDMELRCPSAEIYGVGALEGYELNFKGFPNYAYLTIDKKKNSKVPVGVWKLKEMDIPRLDHYEGYPDLYYKTQMKVTIRRVDINETTMIDGLIYIMNPNNTYAVPSRDYFYQCLEGYKNFKFDPKFLYNALERAVRKRNRNEDH